MTGYYLDKLLGEGEVPSRQLLLDVDIGVESVGELLERLGPLLRALPGDLPQVGHQPEVGALLLGEAGHIAELRHKVERPSLSGALLTHLGHADDQRLVGIPNLLVVLACVIFLYRGNIKSAISLNPYYTM